jgi:cell fate (sporulation/competence/biofilm development) regulator YlbF (YheA/YmcA/DUF963 family)
MGGGSSRVAPNINAVIERQRKNALEANQNAKNAIENLKRIQYALAGKRSTPKTSTTPTQRNINNAARKALQAVVKHHQNELKMIRARRRLKHKSAHYK